MSASQPTPSSSSAFQSSFLSSPRRRKLKKKRPPRPASTEGGPLDNSGVWEDAESDSSGEEGEGESSGAQEDSKGKGKGREKERTDTGIVGRDRSTSITMRAKRPQVIVSPEDQLGRRHSYSSPIRILLRLLSASFSVLFTILNLLSYLIPLIPPLLILGFVGITFYLALSTFYSRLLWLLSFTPTSFHRFLPQSSDLSSSITPHLSSISSSATLLYCSTIGIGCGRINERQWKLNREERLGKVARSANYQAVKTLDIFQSVVALTAQDGPTSGLHRLELLELGAAIGFSSDLPDREYLGEQLVNLGSHTGALRDSMRRITAKSMSSFEWVLHGFDRLERAVNRASIDEGTITKGRYGEKEKTRLHAEVLLEELIDQISHDMSSLLKLLEGAITEADQGTELGQRLMEKLWKADSESRKSLEERTVWEVLVEGRGHKGRKVKRDLELSRESILAVREIRGGLDRARGSLIEYEANVENFQAGIVGFYTSSQSISIEEEVESLSRIVRMFRETRDVARGQGAGGNKGGGAERLELPKGEDGEG